MCYSINKYLKRGEESYYEYRIKIYADFALFARPELSYDIITSSAARGVLEAIYWHPGLKWIVDRIFVLKPIKFVNLTPEKNKTLVLRDVEYIIDAHFEMTEKKTENDNPGKFQNIIRRRLSRKDYYSDIYLGSKEFPAKVEAVLSDEKITTPFNGILNLGFMLYDFDYANNNVPIFFRAKLK